jgi:hypothetical protein
MVAKSEWYWYTVLLLAKLSIKLLTMALLSFCHYSSDPSGAFTIKSIKNDSNKCFYVSIRLAFRHQLLLDFVLYCPCLKAFCLRATPFKPLSFKFGQKGLVGTDSHLICSLFPPRWDQNQTNTENLGKSKSSWWKKKMTNQERSLVYS